MRKLFVLCALFAATGCDSGGPGVEVPTGPTETATAPGTTPPEAAAKGLNSNDATPEGGTDLAQ